MRRAFLAALLGCAVVAPSRAATIFSTGFETTDTPAYATGDLEGQNGWARFDTDNGASDPAVADIKVQNSIASSGSQAVRMTGLQLDGGSQFTYGIGPISLANVATSGTPEVKVQWDMRVESGNTTGVWGIQLFDDNTAPGGPFSYGFAGIGAGPASSQLVKTSAADGNTVVAGGLAPSLGAFHTYILDMNFQQGLYSLSIDGNPTALGLLDLTDTNGNIGEIDLLSAFRGTDTAYFDNFSVNTGTGLVPEPASLGLLGLAGVMLMGRRRKA